MVSIVKCHESHYVGVLDNPQHIWFQLWNFLGHFGHFFPEFLVFYSHFRRDLKVVLKIGSPTHALQVICSQSPPPSFVKVIFGAYTLLSH